MVACCNACGESDNNITIPSRELEKQCMPAEICRKLDCLCRLYLLHTPDVIVQTFVVK